MQTVPPPPPPRGVPGLPPAIPRNVSPLSSICAALGCMPIASTRSPAFVISASPRFACSLAAAENAAVLPLLHTYRHRSRISSGDPFVKEILPSNVSCSVVIRFRSESKAISSIRGMVSSNVSRCMPNAAAISKSANSVGSPRRSPPWRDASLQRENPCKNTGRRPDAVLLPHALCRSRNIFLQSCGSVSVFPSYPSTQR